MEDMLSRAWPFILVGLLPILALLHVPLLARRGSTVWAALLGVIAVGFLADILFIDHSSISMLQVKNMFPRSPDGQPHAWVVDEVMAEAWQWHVVAIVYFGAVAAYAWLVRNRPPVTPRPVMRAVIVFVWALACRLALEKTAALEEVVWAVGVVWASFAIAPFFGWYCGTRGLTFGRWALFLLVANVVQRSLFAAVGWVATTQSLGTHLDVHKVSELDPPFGDPIFFSDPNEAWAYLLLVPQGFAVLGGMIVGLLLGALPWYLARRRAARSAPPAA